MTFECPKCKSPVAREGQRFCYRCGQELNAYYDSMKLQISRAETLVPQADVVINAAQQTPVGTVVLEPHAFDPATSDSPSTPKASLKILLASGDVFDRELAAPETQIGKGPRNDVVIADPAVSTAHVMIRLDGGRYVVNDLGSRNGTFVNGERIESARPLNHGDVIGIGLSKLTFRLADHSETSAIKADEVATARRVGPPPLTEESLAMTVVAAGLASKAGVDRVRGDGSGRRLYRALIEERLASEESLRDLMSSAFEIQIVDLGSSAFDEAIVAELPSRLAIEHQVFPVAKEGDALVLAVADPTDAAALDRVKEQVHYALTLRLASASQIREQVNRHYSPKLIGLLPSGEKLEYAIDNYEVEIGKAAHNHIVLNDPTVSNTHAIVLAREGGYSIVDLGSRNGTFVNAERLGSQARTLTHGDKVQLGSTVLSFRNPAETAANITAVLSSAALEEVRRRAGVTPASLDKAGQQSDQIPRDAQAELPAGAAATVLDVAEVPPLVEDEKGGKKKKKKKKGGKDERLKAAYISGLSRIVAQVMGVILAVLLALYVNSSMRSGSEKAVIETTTKGKAKVKATGSSAGTSIQGGSFEASGVAYVPGANGVLIVDDNRSTEVLWMPIDESGRQAGPVKPIPLGATVDDPEGITSDGTYFYVMGSQSKQSPERNALVRFKFDPASQSVQKAEVMTNLRDFLISNVPELRGERDKKSAEGGLNIEGIAWDFRRGRWLIGLRSPQGKEGQALIVAVKLRDPAGAFSTDNLQLAEPRAIALPLGGLGIRDIQFDPESNSFLIISGAPEHHEKAEFVLWAWDGSVDQPGSEGSLRRETELDPKMKPEGITHVEIGARKFIFIVGDSSTYMKLDYSESQ